MIRKISIFLLIVFLSKGYSQNSVSNTSFEDTVTCQQWLNLGPGKLICIPWYTAIGTSDYFNFSAALNFCGASAICPATPFGYKNPRTGIGMAGFGMATNYREIIGEPFQDSMVGGHVYYVEFYVSRCPNCQLITDDIGAYFSDSLNVGPVYLFNIIPQVENPQGNMLSDTTGWTKISGYYTASGGEQFIYIGNFKSDSNTTYDTVAGAGPSWNFGYYFLDDVSLVDCTATGMNEQQQVTFNLIQNPVVNSVCFTSPLKINVAKVYSTLGLAIKECEFVNQSSYKIDAADLPRGVYFLQVETKDKRRGVKKFIKQ